MIYIGYVVNKILPFFNQSLISPASIACTPLEPLPGTLYRLPCRIARSPRPLEVEAAQLSGDIHDLADEIQPRHFIALHGFRRQRARVDAAAGHFGLGVAQRAARGDLPIVQLHDDLFALFVVILVERLVFDL